MKKLLIIILLLTAAGAYSQERTSLIDLKAQVYGGFNLLFANTDDDEETVMGGLNTGKGEIEINGEKGKFGGMLRLGYEFEKEFYGDFDVFWKHSDFFAFYITYNEDGHFPLDNIAGWNFYGFPGDVLGLEGCAGSHAFYSGFTRGSFVKLNPVKEFEINWGLNVFNPDTGEYMLKSMTLQAAYDFNEIAKIGVTYEGDYMTDENLDDNPVVSLYFNYSGITNTDFDIGIRYQFYDTYEQGNVKHTLHHPINLGAGVVFSLEKFTLKTRMNMSFLGSYKYGDEKSKIPFDIGLDILPSYSFTDNIKGYFNAGVYFTSPEKPEGEEESNVQGDFLWRLNPYLVIGDEKAGAFYVGVTLFNTVINHDVLHFAIPIGLSIVF